MGDCPNNISICVVRTHRAPYGGATAPDPYPGSSTYGTSLNPNFARTADTYPTDGNGTPTATRPYEATGGGSG
jgi:hypothetical protein